MKTIITMITCVAILLSFSTGLRAEQKEFRKIGQAARTLPGYVPQYAPQADPCAITKEEIEAAPGEYVIKGCVVNVEFGRAPNSCIIWFGTNSADAYLVNEINNGMCGLGIASVTNSEPVIAYVRPAAWVDAAEGANPMEVNFMKFDK